MWKRFSFSRPVLLLCSMLAVLVLLAACSTASDTSSDSKESAAPQDASAPAEVKAESIPTSIVLDASGSMKAEDAPGQRFAAAQKAFKGLVDAVPEGQETSLLTYGTGTGSTDAEMTEGCQDVTTLIKAGPVDKDQYVDAVNNLEPSGYTPIALALQKANEQLPKSGKRAIILLSDGIDTCAEKGESLDPCAVAKDLGADGELAIHTVGFRVDGQASKQLECLSTATNGTSWDAVNDKQLDSRLALALNPQLAESTLTPEGYRGLTPGMSADEARQAGGFSNDIANSGRVEIVYVDCTLVFVDGVLTEIVSEKTPTLDGLAPGDDISAAEAIYANPDLPTEVTKDGAALYTADPIAGTGFKIYFEGAADHRAGDALKGTILKIVFCKCMTTDSYSVAAPPVGIFPGCAIQSQCTVVDAVQLQHPKQGPLTLVMLSVDNGYDDAKGRLLVVDADGKVMETDGSIAGPTDTSEHLFDTYAVGDQPLNEVLHFMRPTTDRSGAVFYSAISDDGQLSLTLKVDRTGYFTEDSYEIDWDRALQVGGGGEDSYYTSSWGDIDDNGYYTLVLGEGPHAVTLHREGNKYVVDEK